MIQEEQKQQDPEKDIPHMVIVSQVVRDIKVGGGARRKELATEIGRLRASLKDIYIPGDKLNATFHPQTLDANNVLKVQICAGVLEGSDLHAKLPPHFFPEFPLDLRDPHSLSDVSRMQLEEVLLHCNDVEVDDGGNAQNMAMNACLAGMSSAMLGKIKITILSTSDPFKRLIEPVCEKLSHQFSYYLLDGIPDRIAIQVPWKYATGESGNFALTTEPADTTDIVKKLLADRSDVRLAFAQSNSFVSSDPSFEVIRHHAQPGKYCIIVNAATRWRSKIANIAYGTDIILPMNNKEAGDVERIVEHVGAEEEMHKVKPRPFPSPFMPNGHDVNKKQLQQLDEALWKLSQYNHLHRRQNGLIAFNCPITFEAEGGLVAGTREGESIVAFTTTISDPKKEQQLIDEFGDHKEMNKGDMMTIGAGDASATVIAIFNTINPQDYIEPYLEGQEKNKLGLHHYAQTIFASAMSRIVGNFLIRTKRCHWSNIDLQKFKQLFDDTALDSLNVARDLFYQRDEYGVGELNKSGIRVVTWSLGAISNPNTQ